MSLKSNPAPVESPQALTVSLSQYFRDRAGWARRDLGDDWEALGQIDAAQLQEQFADYLVRLPDDDLRIVALGRLVPSDSEGAFAPGPKVSAALGSIDLYGSSGFGVFLESLVHAAIDDIVSWEQHLGASFLESSDVQPQAEN